MLYHSFIYVALGIIILHRLSLNIIIERRKNKVSFGDDGNRTLMRRIRAQGNFIEYTPIFLISLITLEWDSRGISNAELIIDGTKEDLKPTFIPNWSKISRVELSY